LGLKERQVWDIEIGIEKDEIDEIPRFFKESSSHVSRLEEGEFISRNPLIPLTLIHSPSPCPCPYFSTFRVKFDVGQVTYTFFLIY